MTIPTEHMSSARCEPEQSEGADVPSQAEPQAKPGEGTASSKLKKWQTLAGLLIGYSQTLVRLERVNDARAWEVAEALEISTRSSLALCMKDIHALHDGDPPSTEEETDAFERIHAIASGLLALSYYVRKIKRRLAGRGVARRISESSVARPSIDEMMSYASPVYEIPQLDPGWPERGSLHPERRRRMTIGSARAHPSTRPALYPSTSLRMSAAI